MSKSRDPQAHFHPETPPAEPVQEPILTPEPADPPSVEITGTVKRRRLVNVRPSVDALMRCSEILEGIEQADRVRVLEWLCSEYMPLPLPLPTGLAERSA